MVMEFFVHGIAIGFAIAAPVGPIGMLVIRRTLAEGRMLGLVTGLGAAVADTLYGAVGAFGLSFVSGFLVGHAFWTRLIGGLFLCGLGIRTFRARVREGAMDAPTASYLAAFATTVLLTLANPLTILSFMAVFAGLGLDAGAGYGVASLVVTGVFLGSAFWWVLLSGGVALLRHKLEPAAVRWINRGSGLFLLAYGLAALARAA